MSSVAQKCNDNVTIERQDAIVNYFLLKLSKMIEWSLLNSLITLLLNLRRVAYLNGQIKQ